MCSSLLLPVLSSTSLLLFFLFILSFPFLSFRLLPGSAPVLETWMYPSHLADAFIRGSPRFGDANFLPNFSSEGGGDGGERKVQEAKREPLSPPPDPPVVICLSPLFRRSGCLIVFGNFSLEAGRRIYRSFKCGAYKNTGEWSLRFMHS